MEAEEFTSRLYKELNSSPQPYLVPFLKVRMPKFQFNFHSRSVVVAVSCVPLMFSTCVSSLAKPPDLEAAHPRLSCLYPAEPAPPASLRSSVLHLTHHCHSGPQQPDASPRCSGQQATAPSAHYQARTDRLTGELTILCHKFQPETLKLLARNHW